ISRRARSSTMESMLILRCSWLLAQKCFSETPTPADCTPCTHAAPIRPARKGSSEKYSKFLPQRGERLMLTPGPSTVDTPSALASAAMALPTVAMRSGSHVLAEVTAGGKQVAGWDCFV